MRKLSDNTQDVNCTEPIDEVCVERGRESLSR